MRNLADLDCNGKAVLVRVDYNVPLEEGVVKDDTRLKATLPTLQKLQNSGARQIILCTHLGRPKGESLSELSLKPVSVRLQSLLNKPVQFSEHWQREKPTGNIVLLENLRFHKEEEANDDGFAKLLATLADVFVQDAFGTLHRAHASTVGITQYLPSCAGLLVEKELTTLYNLLASPKKPFVAVLGGVKLSGKLAIIKNLLTKVDHLLIGGAMMFTFYKAKGLSVGNSIVEENFLTEAQELLHNEKIILPTDVVIAQERAPDAPTKLAEITSIPSDWIGLDVGEQTIANYRDYLAKAGTIFWNGPLGIFEWKNFALGTLGVAHAIAENTKAFTVVGGGDSARAVHDFGLSESYSHISTGGGASLDYIGGKALPGVVALEKHL